MPYFDKHFTIDEANALLPRLREIFQRIHALIREAGQPLPAFEPASANLGRTNGKHGRSGRDRSRILQEINELVTEITDMGIVIQDISRGLLDFPSYIEGEEVFLCYEPADGDVIRYWHPLNTGYGGRHLLPQKETE